MSPYEESILRASRYIENNLADDLAWDDVARVSGFSKFHFSRIFRALTKDTLQEYIRKRRLTHAARDLIETSQSLIDLSFSFGYSSQEAFTRAFKSFFGVSPQNYRKKSTHYYNLYKEALTPNLLSTKKQEAALPTRVVTKNAFRIAGIPLSGSLDNDGISRLWNRFYEELEKSPPLPYATPMTYYGIETVDSQCNAYYVAGVELEALIELPDGWTIISVPEQKYIVFRLDGLIENIPFAIERIYRNLLPDMNIKPIGDLHFECYSEDFLANSSAHAFDFYVPIP